MSRTCAKRVALYLLHACRFSSLVLAICSGVGGGGFGRGGCCFFFSARHCCLRLKMASLFCIYHSCLRCLANSGSLLGILNKTGSCLGSFSLSIVLPTNHSPRSPCPSNRSPDHHLSPFHQSPEDQLICLHPFEIM